jgi:hypothetical protein
LQESIKSTAFSLSAPRLSLTLCRYGQNTSEIYS